MAREQRLGEVRDGVVVVIEDVVTSGGQVCTSVLQMRELGLVVEHVVCVTDREEGGARNIVDIGCSFAALFTMAELEDLITA